MDETYTGPLESAPTDEPAVPDEGDLDSADAQTELER